jgi:hypothetical protein
MALFTPEAPLTELDFVAAPTGGGVRGVSLDTYLRWMLAAMSGTAAVLHFAFASIHFSEYWAYGAFFIAVGWYQLTWAIGVVTRPSRLVLAAGVLNVGVIAAWAVSRTVGVGFGPHASATEAVALPDVLATVLEGLIVIGAVVLAVRPGVARRAVRHRGTALGAVSLAGAAFIALGTTAVTPRFAGAHGVAGHVHAGGAGHTHPAAAGGATGTSPCEKSGPPASVGQVQDSSGHNHRGPTAQLPIDEATRFQLQQQQAVARSVADKYPTLADAEKAGYHQNTVYVPCIGAHYSNFGYAGSFDVAHPSELLYDGTSPGSHIVGLSYLLFHPGGAPEGFAGPNDRWHQHNVNGGLCLKGALVVGGEQTSVAECVARGGRKVPLPDIWMLHDWIVPGFECSWGVFAAECPELGGRVGGTAYDTPDPRQLPIPQG